MKTAYNSAHIPRSSLTHLGTKNIPTDQIHRQTVCGSGHPRHASGPEGGWPEEDRRGTGKCEQI